VISVVIIEMVTLVIIPKAIEIFT